MEFDYIVVGGGSAGCVIAARLSEDPTVSVCLIEAGGRGDSVFVRAPALVAAMVSGRPKINNWAFHTVPQDGLNGRRGFQPRGKALGGSSAINAMLYVRGHQSDYDDWANAGCEGWDFESLLPYFRKSEGNQRGPDALHGARGPLQVADQSEPRAINAGFEAACNAQQIASNPDFNGPQQEGVGLFQVTQFHKGSLKGQRCSAAAAYLSEAGTRPNLTILTRCQARRVRIEDGRATGVEIRHNNQNKCLTARREVVVSAGAFGSPKMLMLSGIGPRDELERHGIEVKHELAGVGQNLQDHVDYILNYRNKRRDTVGLNPAGLATLTRAALKWRKTGEGLFATPFAESSAFFRTDPALTRPDVQLHFVVAIVDDHNRKMHLPHGFSCHACVLRPHSRGTVGLTSSDPGKPPRIDPAYFKDDRDMRTMMAAARQMETILQDPALAPWRGQKYYAHDGSPPALEADIRQRADSIYHPVGTCKMGVDDMAVVDPQGRVHGVTGLRVADASIMPTLIGGNTNAPTIVIGEKIAEALMADA